MGWSTTGEDVETGKQVASSILFAKNGAETIRQVETVETEEVRGMLAANAKNKVVLDDHTEQTVYWANIGGAVYSITVTSGYKVEWSAARVDESGQWVATKRKTTYTTYPAQLPSAWGTTELNAEGQAVALSASGVSHDIAVDLSRSVLWSFNGKPVTQTLKTETSEIRYVTNKSAAYSLVSANTSNSVRDVQLVQDVTIVMGNGQTSTFVGAWCIVKSGVEKFASARYVSEKEGWCVTVTTKTHGYEAAGWRT